jgi:cobalt/nickel transport system permease protein
MPDRFAYSNALRNVHPAEKLFFSLSCMLISLIGGSRYIHLTVFFIMVAAALFMARIPLRYYLKVMAAAVVFIFLGSAAVAYNFTDFYGAAFVFSRASAAISCFYFLILTTPVADILSVLRKIRVPPVVLELMGLTYRFIFVFMDISQKTRTAQASRLGYGTLKNSYRATGILISSLFARMFRQVDNLNAVLDSRGFTGELTVMQRQFTFSVTNIVAIALLDIVLIAAGTLYLK